MGTISYSTVKGNKILECLKYNSNSDMTVKDIEAVLKSAGLDVNISTIYRNLDKLEHQGLIIKRVDESGNKSTYQYAEPENQCHEHLHMKCSGCGKVYHLDCEFMKDFKSHMLEHHGFTLECKSSMLYGMCELCSSQNFDNDIKIRT